MPDAIAASTEIMRISCHILRKKYNRFAISTYREFIKMESSKTGNSMHFKKGIEVRFGSLRVRCCGTNNNNLACDNKFRLSLLISC